MPVLRPTHILNILLLVLALVLSSCGAGTTTVGSGGSGLGGTGITRVRGNVAEVVAEVRSPGSGNLFVAAVAWVSTPVAAQSPNLQGITVSGGGQSTVTDGTGSFELTGVVPSENFVLTFEPPQGKPSVLELGVVTPGASVQVSNVVVNSEQGTATAAEIEITEPDPPVDESCPGNAQQSCQADPGNQGGNGSGNNPGQGQGNQGQGNQGQGQGNQGQGNQGQGNQGQGNQGQGQGNQG